jgi:hypothetical protein
MSTIMFDSQMQTTYLVGNRVKNIVKVGGGARLDNAHICRTLNFLRLKFGGYKSKEVISEILAGHPKGPTSYPMTRELLAQPPQKITYISLFSYT